MANLNRFQVNIKTSNINNAETDGSVYIGICGREFHCNTTADNFKRDSLNTFNFGVGANVVNAANNDPRNPVLLTEDVDRFPVYIRFEQDPKDLDGGEWNLEGVDVRLNGTIFVQYKSRITKGLWLGKTSGAIHHLRKHSDVVNPA
jgi:hypothetical protein